MDKRYIMNEFKSMAKDTRIDDQVIEELLKMGYFDAPASKGHHLACPGGLAMHSMGVATCLRSMTAFMHLTWDRPDSPEVIGLLHDLCKVDQYIPHTDHTVMIGDVQVSSGDIERVTYTWNDNQLISGHGDKSVMLIAPLLRLTIE